MMQMLKKDCIYGYFLSSVNESDSTSVVHHIHCREEFRPLPKHQKIPEEAKGGEKMTQQTVAFSI